MTEKDWCPWLSIQQFFVICTDLDSKYNNKQYYNGKKLPLKLMVIGDHIKLPAPGSIEVGVS